MSLAGSFLVAKPILRDPNFLRTVVIVLAHNDEGALGLVVNRPSSAEGLPLPLFEGGPCPSSGLFLLHGNSVWAEDTDAQVVAPGVYVGDAEVFERAAQAEEEPRLRVRVFRGYAGWAPASSSASWRPATGRSPRPTANSSSTRRRPTCGATSSRP